MSGQADQTETPIPRLFQHFKMRGLEPINRVVVAPMGRHARDHGMPGDYRLARLGSRAIGAADLRRGYLGPVAAAAE